MIRLLAVAALVAAMGGTGLAGMRLAEVFSAEAPGTPAAEPGVVPGTASTVDDGVADEARPFLPIYGTPPPARASPPQTDASDPAVAYTLRGVVTSGAMRWAILRGPEADLVVGEGDVLPDGARVARVHAEGVELGRSDGRIERIGFTVAARVRRAEVAPAASVASASASATAGPDRPSPSGRGPPRGAILFQDMSGAEIMAAMEAAEQRRIERGWVTR